MTEAKRVGGEAVVVVPCFNEAARLDVDALTGLAREPGLRLLFVDDGSTDRTGDVLASMRAALPDAIDVLTLAANVGKGEAVRFGMQRGAAGREGEGAAAIVGYLDADLATPPDEMLRLREELERTGADVVIGARVALMGRDIVRRPARHYLGRVFSTAASLVLRAPIYDTQCGAKLFRATPALARALDRPFVARWAFDVELLGRFLADGIASGSSPDIREVPLRRWHHRPGSKLGFGSSLRAGLDLLRIDAELRRRRSGR
jgi:glycosyltransferase involved in cell wall biosynthesis